LHLLDLRPERFGINLGEQVACMDFLPLGKGDLPQLAVDPGEGWNRVSGAPLIPCQTL
jgi:hypothetical protein